MATAPHTHGNPGGHVQAPVGGLGEALLDESVLAGVVRQHGDPPVRRGGVDRLVERSGELVELAVDLDAEGLERALGRMATGSSGGCRDRRRHDRRELGGRRDRSGGDDRPGDAAGEPLVAVLADDPGEGRPRRSR